MDHATAQEIGVRHLQELAHQLRVNLSPVDEGGDQRAVFSSVFLCLLCGELWLGKHAIIKLIEDLVIAQFVFRGLLAILLDHALGRALETRKQQALSRDLLCLARLAVR